MTSLDDASPGADDGGGSVFFVGSNYASLDGISRSYLLGAKGADDPKASVPDGQWPPVAPVEYKPCYARNGCKICLCCGPRGFNQTFLDPDMAIPPEAMSSSGLTEAEIRSLVSDVGNELNGRVWCCWKLGWLGPALPVLWLGDLVTHGCLFKNICYNQSHEAIQRHIKRHNEAFKNKGVHVSLEDETRAIKTVDMSYGVPTERTATHLQTWVMAVTTLPPMER